MLILSRRCGESIVIGDDVEVFVVDIGDGKVRLGVAGPPRLPVHQRERYDARQRARARGIRTSTDGDSARRRHGALTVSLSHNI
jgi:carbon storage regulator